MKSNNCERKGRLESFRQVWLTHPPSQNKCPSVNFIIDRELRHISLTCDEEPASDEIPYIGGLVYGHPCFKLDS